MKRAVFTTCLGALSCLLVAALMTGCESDAYESGAVEEYFDGNPYEAQAQNQPGALAITPAAVELTADGQQAKFTVTGGYPPYAWGVEDQVAGAIISSASDSVVYRRDGAFNNVIWVRDANKTKVQSTISQP